MRLKLIGDWHEAARRLSASLPKSKRELAECQRVSELYVELPRPVQNKYAEHELRPDVVFQHPRCGHRLTSVDDLYRRPRPRGLFARECRECKREEKRGPTGEQVRQERLRAARQKSPVQS